MIELARMPCDQAAQLAGRSAPRYFLVELDAVLSGGPTLASAAIAPPIGMPPAKSAAESRVITACRLIAFSTSVALSLSPPQPISIRIRPSLRQSLTPSFSVSAIPVHIPRTLHPKLSLPPPLPGISTVAVAWSISVSLTHCVGAGFVRRA